jgi:ParB/RepB/Spo0J family partition protein
MQSDKIQEVQITLIDEPSYAMRTQMDAEKMSELEESISKHGLISPIVLRKSGKRYEIVAGHRRFCACQRLNLATVTAIVKELSDIDTDAMRMHENFYREDINPVDEARYIRTMIDVHGLEPEALCKMTGKRVQYLKSRYELLDYPEYLIDAIQQESLSLGAAEWLAKIEDDNVRREYTRFAIGTGITAKTAQAWHATWLLGALPREASDYVPPEVAEDSTPRVINMPCVICRDECDINTMQMHYCHGDCVESMAKHMRELKAREVQGGNNSGVEAAC